MIKLIAFDLDGTLTQHKMPLEAENKAVLDRLRLSYRLLIIGAGRCTRIHRQLLGYPIDIIGNYGMQYGRADAQGGLTLLYDRQLPCDADSVTSRIEALRRRFGFTEYKGKSTELHPSGCVTFPILGTEATLSEKLAFDPDRSKRSAIYREVCEVFSEYQVFIGGTSSFDMAPNPYNKAYALGRYLEENGLRREDVLYLGDDGGVGGNDESVKLAGYDFIDVQDYRRLGELLAERGVFQQEALQ